jgi:hypothetical protein
MLLHEGEVRKMKTTLSKREPLKKILKSITFLPFLICVSLTYAKNAFSEVGSWVMKADTIYPWDGGIGEVDGKVHFIHACWNHTEYDLSTNIWTARAGLPFPDCHAASLGSSGGILYKFGAEAGGGIYPYTLEYTPSSDSWSSRSNMITARGLSTVATVSDKIYVIGGYKSNRCPGGGGGCPHDITDVNEVYDPFNNSWTSKTPIPTPRTMATSAVVKGKIYVIGGKTSSDPSSDGTPTNIVEEYDPSTDTWTTRAPMPTARFSIAAVVKNGYIYVIGGDPRNPEGTIERYDPLTDTWTTGFTPLPLRPDERVQRTAGPLSATGGNLYTFTQLNAWEFILELTVQIDIKPGSDPNCFNNDGHGVIPVAILGGPDFDVRDIDPGTIRLESLEIKAVGKNDKLLANYEDIDSDGYEDLVVQIQDADGVFTEGDGTATLIGELYDGTPIEGNDSICVVQ